VIEGALPDSWFHSYLQDGVGIGLNRPLALSEIGSCIACALSWIDDEGYCQPIAGCAVNLVAFVGGYDLESFWQPFDFGCFVHPTGNTNQGALGTSHCFCLQVKYYHRTASVA